MDRETMMALEGAQAASEAQLDRDLRDLELLRKIRGHAWAAQAVAMFRDEAEFLDHVDYFHCNVCDAKAFYDADINWESQHVELRYDGWPASVVALCSECWKTHKIVVVQRDSTEGAVDGNP